MFLLHSVLPCSLRGHGIPPPPPGRALSLPFSRFYLRQAHRKLPLTPTTAGSVFTGRDHHVARGVWVCDRSVGVLVLQLHPADKEQHGAQRGAPDEGKGGGVFWTHQPANRLIKRVSALVVSTRPWPAPHVRSLTLALPVDDTVVAYIWRIRSRAVPWLATRKLPLALYQAREARYGVLA